VISTVAGGVGGPAKATKVALSNPGGVSFAGGRLYIADFRTVREVDPGTDRLTTPAGIGVSGPLGDGGPATLAALGTSGAAVDDAGNLVIADAQNQRVRVVAASTATFYGRAMTAGHIYTVAGNGTQGFSGDGRKATKAELALPLGVAVDSPGNLVIADYQNNRIRVVAARTGTFYGQPMTAGDIYTVAGNGTGGFSGDGGPATSAELDSPQGVTVDGAGNLVIADTANERVRVVAARTGTFYGQPMTAGDIYTVAGGGTGGLGDGGPATAATLNEPGGTALDGAGNLVIADEINSRIRVVAARTGTFYGQPMTAGDIYTVAGNGTQGFSGDGGPATSAELKIPQDVTVDGTGNLVIADTDNGRVRVVAARTGTLYGQAMTAGDIYTVAGHRSGGLAGDHGPALHAQFSSPMGVVTDGAGNRVIADQFNRQIWVAAVTTGTFYGQAMTAGDIYVIAGNGTGGFSGDGGPATRAQLSFPQGVAVDGAGNVVITVNSRVRVVAARTGTFYGRPMTAGDIYTLAGNGIVGFSGDGGPARSAELNEPDGVAVDGAGNLMIADTINSRVRVVAARTGTFYGRAMTAGDIYTVAGNGTQGFSGDGGPATSAELRIPRDVTVDSAGNLVIADTINSRVRVVAARTGTFYGQPMTAGDIYTVAGNGIFGFSGDGGPATSAALNEPGGVAVDGAGNLVIADTINSRVRVVAASTGMFYGRAMTAGDIYTVAGNGIVGFSGDGGPGTTAGLAGPFAVAVDGAGNLVIADTGNERIRVVAG
jgi:hypothetical protein